jgi:hypothetical protein
MASSIDKNEEQQENFNSSDQLSHHVKFNDNKRKNSIITQDESSTASRQGL